MKKMVCWAVLAAAVVFTGCRQTSAVPDTVMTEAEEEKVLTVLMPYDNPVSQKIVTELFKEYETAHEGVKIQVEWESYRNYENRLSSLSKAGQMPDLALVDNAYVPQLAAKELIQPLDLWLNKTGLAAVLETEMQDGLMIGESQYGCPFLCWSYGLFFNDHIREKSNSEYPETWGEFLEYCKKTEIALNTTPLGLAASGTEELTYQFLEILQGCDMDLRRLRYAEECSAIEYIGEMTETGVLTPGCLNWDQADLTRMFARGGMGCMLNRSTQIPFLASRTPGFEWKVLEPYLEGEGRHTLGIESLVMLVNAGEQSYELVEWLMMPEQVLRFSLEMNSIPVRSDIRDGIETHLEAGTYVDMDWEGRMQFSDKYMSWESISQEIRLHVRNLIKQETDKSECFRELQYNIGQYIYLLVH